MHFFKNWALKFDQYFKAHLNMQFSHAVSGQSQELILFLHFSNFNSIIQAMVWEVLCMLKYHLLQACGAGAEEEVSGAVAVAEVDLVVPVTEVIWMLVSCITFIYHCDI